MKKILSLFILLLSIEVSATHYYVATVANGGSDAKTGLTGQPWATVSKAATTAANGDTVTFGIGTFDISSTVSPANVKWFGTDSTQTIINCTNASGYSISFASGDFSAYPIVLQDIRFEGNLTSLYGIQFYKKNNVTIERCVFNGFINRAILATNSTPPSTWATGFQLLNSRVYNCALYNANASASVMMTGQKDYTIAGCKIINPKRGTYSAACVKLNYTQHGLIHDNIIQVLDHNDNAAWSFAVEYWNSNGGDELYDNTINGVVDMVGGTFTVGTYAFQLSIHGNTIGWDTPQSILRHGVYCEVDTHNTLIYDNTIQNVQVGIILMTNSIATHRNIEIYRNKIINIGTLVSGYTCYGIKQGGTGGYTMTDVYLYNNIITAYSSSASTVAVGINLPESGTVRDFRAQNNIIQGWVIAPIRTSVNSGTIDTLMLTNNDMYGNGNNNAIKLTGGIVPTHYTATNNITSNPLFISSTDYHLQTLSPCINAGIDVGLPYLYSAPDIGAYEYVIENPAVISTVLLGDPINVTSRTVLITATVATDGGGTISERGICYSTSPNPTTSMLKTVNGSGLGDFTSMIQDLVTSTIYYIRAYAINEAGTAYSNQVTFTTKFSSSLYHLGKKLNHYRH